MEFGGERCRLAPGPQSSAKRQMTLEELARWIGAIAEAWDVPALTALEASLVEEWPGDDATSTLVRTIAAKRARLAARN